MLAKFNGGGYNTTTRSCSPPVNRAGNLYILRHIVQSQSARGDRALSEKAPMVHARVIRRSNSWQQADDLREP